MVSAVQPSATLARPPTADQDVVINVALEGGGFLLTKRQASIAGGQVATLVAPRTVRESRRKRSAWWRPQTLLEVVSSERWEFLLAVGFAAMLLPCLLSLAVLAGFGLVLVTLALAILSVLCSPFIV